MAFATRDQVIYIADLAAKQAMENLSKNEAFLHQNGYHQWSTALANMRNKIERALMELIDEIMED